VTLVAQAQSFDQATAIDRCLVKRPPERHGLPHGDALLKLGFLKLHADAFLQRMSVASGTQAQH
jgi:hypothetical protein